MISGRTCRGSGLAESAVPTGPAPAMRVRFMFWPRKLPYSALLGEYSPLYAPKCCRQLPTNADFGTRIREFDWLFECALRVGASTPSAINDSFNSAVLAMTIWFAAPEGRLALGPSTGRILLS